ncbi:MAG: hypothetical protein IKI58_11995 [Oscillospiraceae bacterium]|nr:hypothetical protein [Oscillospiraceae bacterium]
MNQLMLPGFAALPLGDDTPVLIYVLLGVGALVLLIGATALGKLSEAKKARKKKDKKKRS